MPDPAVVLAAGKPPDTRALGPARSDLFDFGGRVPQGDGPDLAGPTLHDATRAMELAEATARSLRKGRTVDLYYEPISEEASFKSVMTSTGCMLIIGRS